MSTRSSLVALFTAATLVAGGVAQAAWLTVGAGSASAAAGTIAAPTAVTATASGQTVTVSWTAPTTGARPASYAVTRGSVTVCASTTGTSCVEHNVPIGQHTYSVTSRLHAWSSPATAANVAVAASQVSTTLTAMPINATGPGNHWNVSARITVNRTTGGGVSGASVAWAFDGASGTCTTAADGTCVVTSGTNASASKTLTISSVTVPNATWTGSQASLTVTR